MQINFISWSFYHCWNIRVFSINLHSTLPQRRLCNTAMKYMKVKSMSCFYFVEWSHWTIFNNRGPQRSRESTAIPAHLRHIPTQFSCHVLLQWSHKLCHFPNRTALQEQLQKPSRFLPLPSLPPRKGFTTSRVWLAFASASVFLMEINALVNVIRFCSVLTVQSDRFRYLF